MAKSNKNSKPIMKSTQICPYCKEVIKINAIKCKYCHSFIRHPSHKGKCPFCDETIDPEAVKCKHCKSYIGGTYEEAPEYPYRYRKKGDSDGDDEGGELVYVGGLPPEVVYVGPKYIWPPTLRKSKPGLSQCMQRCDRIEDPGKRIECIINCVKNWSKPNPNDM